MSETIGAARDRLDRAVTLLGNANMANGKARAHEFAIQVANLAQTTDHTIRAQQNCLGQAMQIIQEQRREIDGLHGRLGELERRFGMGRD
ncbi:hypothetical protein [Chitiniphilus eburneus]|uniref:hypothetical protein n=1 Tax=Chitiniphilus eburneus TaxID=2571148 RepID=UPI0035CF4151